MQNGQLSKGTDSDAPTARIAPRQVLREAVDGFELELELPGVAPESVTLDVEDRVLRLEASPSTEPSAEGLRPLLREFAPTGFAARWRLAKDVDEERIETRYRAGVLTIRLPRREPERRSIPILET